MKAILNPALVQEMFRNVVDSHTKMYEMAAFWMDSTVKTSREIKRRLVPGDEICLSNDTIVNCYGDAEYKIISIKGTLDNSVMKMELENLITKAIKTIDV